ncbi:ABC1 kinase family protein [Zavarzinella formosa]|uniref:ABC1 kinase family protein n=1 Tax=Zavarzinella formosa TaxID=360055 RepID=UPI000316EB02|nr:AarF/ABC1/UbiB kinase family protein [Zavarzinella formosa]
MNIDFTRIPQLAGNIARLVEISAVLVKFGIADWLGRMDSHFIGRFVRRSPLANLAGVTHEARIRMAFTELGTTFIKFGQILSTRRDLVGLALADELAHLQSSVPPDPFEVSKATIERELKKPLAELFATFEETPVASGSIGQVYRATLRDGTMVAVKVQHPDIADRIHKDLSILRTLAELAEANLSDLRAYRPVKTVGEFQRVLLRELDFNRELRNLQLFGQNFANDETVRFPRPHPELSTGSVLVMDFLPGLPLTDPTSVRAAGIDLDELARRGAKLCLQMIFRDGFFHADPHPGNIIVLPGGQIGLIDVGMVGRIDDALRSTIEEGLEAIDSRDFAHLTELILQAGDVPADVESAEVQAEVSEQLAFYWGIPMDKFRIGPALNDFSEAIRKFQIALPPSISLLMKVFIVLEGTCQRLSPKFNIAELLVDFQKKAVLKRLSPKSFLKRSWIAAKDWEELIRSLPRQVRSLFRQARQQEIIVRLRHEHLEPSVNRLVFGMMTSALFVGSAMMWAYQAAPLVRGVSLFGVLGCVTSGVLGFRLFRAIQHSGKLEERK